MSRLRVLTWHIHGNYLYYLSQADVDFYLPTKPAGGSGYHGRGTSFPFGDNVHELPAEQVRHEQFDCILFQHKDNWMHDQFEILSDEQRRLPKVYLEHDPPLGHPTDTRHWVEGTDVLLVHVTPFNALMWDAGDTPTRVIEHGVLVPPEVRYTGEHDRGIVVVNNLGRRGRRLGPDVFQQVRHAVPLDLVGMNSDELGGRGEIRPPELPAFVARYRFFFNPIRYTSLGLAVCEAMTVGLPIIGLATTEMATVVRSGEHGFVDTDVARLVPHMQRLLADRDEARELGAAARRYALQRFDIRRFAGEWTQTLAEVAGRPHARPSRAQPAGT